MISGTPGTGKTEISVRLSKRLGFCLVKINDFAQAHGLVEGIDKKRGSLIIDEKKLKAAVAKLSGDVIVEGHLAHFCKSDVVAVLRTNPTELEKRLLSRGWNRKKILENVEAEILDIILQEAVNANKNVVEVDTTGKSADAVCGILADVIKSRNYSGHKLGTVSWASYFDKYF
ncbi:MAG: adenylate kinase family protein [archaeon]|nr:adenylate kinase family protein [archaeon]